MRAARRPAEWPQGTWQAVTRPPGARRAVSREGVQVVEEARVARGHAVPVVDLDGTVGMRPQDATAAAIAIRWSWWDATPPARRPSGPSPKTTQRPPRPQASPPSARTIATTVAIRSLSFVRSSSASRNSSEPLTASAPATARAGTSSIRSGSCAPVTTVPVSSRPRARTVPPARSMSRSAPMASRTSRKPLRSGDRYRFSTVTSEPGTAAAAQIQKAACDGSPGTANSPGWTGPGCSVMTLPSPSVLAS